MHQQPYHRSITLNDAWPDTFCRECKASVEADPGWRQTRIGWSEVLQIAESLYGQPTGFYTRDFLIIFEFGEARLVFCGQGPRRGEVQLSVPADPESDDQLLRAFLGEIRLVIEKDRVAEPESEEEVLF